MIFSLFSADVNIYTFAALLAGIVSLLVALSLHEFAHAFAAYKMGDDTAKNMGRLSLNPLRHLDPIGTVCLLLFYFGYAKPVPVDTSKFKRYKLGMILVSLAGVITNIILAFISALLFLIVSKHFLSPNFSSAFLQHLFYYFTVFNISLFIFNLIPVYPLDGFNFVSSLISDFRKKSSFIKFNMQYGSMLLIMVIIIGSELIWYANEFIFNGFLSFWSLLL